MCSCALLGGSRGNAVTVVTGDDAASVARGADARASLRAAGFRVSAPLAVVPPVDPTSVARQLVAGVVPPPAAVLLLAGATTSRSIAQQLAALGYTGTVGVGDELYTPTTPAVGVGLTALTTIAPLEADTASLHQMVDDVRAVDPAAVITPSVEQGYFAADFFLAVLRRVGRRLDVARFQAVANGGRFSYEVARTVGRSTWPAMHTDSVPCGACWRRAMAWATRSSSRTGATRRCRAGQGTTVSPRHRRGGSRPSSSPGTTRPRRRSARRGCR